MKRLLPLIALLLCCIFAGILPWAIVHSQSMSGPTKHAGPTTVSQGVLLVSDYFTRTDASTLGANWSDSLGNTIPLKIVSNQAVASAAGASEIWTANSFTSNQFSQATFTTLPDTGTGLDDLQVMTRTLAASANGYACGLRVLIDGTHYTMWKLVVGALTQVGPTSSTTVTAGDVVYLSAVGTTLTCKANGLTVVTATDSSLSSGYPGLRMAFANTTGAFTLWSGGNL